MRITLLLLFSLAVSPLSLARDDDARAAALSPPPGPVIDIEGREQSLSAWDPSTRFLVLAWTSADCPMARLYAPRLKSIIADHAKQPVRFLVLDSSAQDSVEDVQKLARDRAYGAPVVRDEQARLARHFHAERTTEVLVLDRKLRARYRGAIDDQYGFRKAEGTVGTYRRDAPTRSWLVEALERLLAGEEPPVTSTDALGCAIGLDWRDASDAPAAPARVEREAGEAIATPTYHQDVAPILRRRCESCHHTGGVAPFALSSFEDASSWAPTLREVVESRRMPPWNADPAHGRFANDRSLSAIEIATLARWAEGGTPRGDASEILPAASWSDAWVLGEPDLILDTDAFEVPAEGRVPYRYVAVETSFPEDRWIRAAQFRSDEPSLVHHVLTFADAPAATAEQRVTRPWTPPFVVFDLLEGAPRSDWNHWIRRNRKLLRHLRDDQAGGLNGYFLAALPGDSATVYPESQARLLPAGARIVFQIHYTPDGRARASRTRLGLWFADAPPAEPVDVRAASTVVFEIPPGESEYRVEASFKFPREGKLLSLRPHMHYRGRSFRYIAELPDGREETLLHVPRFDFDWQLEYVLAEPRALPPGTVLRAIGIYDNSDANPYNPDPTATVYFGLESEKEMFIGYFEAVWKSASD